MKIRPPGTDDAKFDMTPMMDIVFQLIAFFMIVATIVSLEKIELDLPVAENSAMAEVKTGRLQLSIGPDGTLYLGSRLLTLEELATGVAAWAAETPQGKVVIRSDRTTPYASVKQVMKVLRDAGRSDIIFASYQSDS